MLRIARRRWLLGVFLSWCGASTVSAEIIVNGGQVPWFGELSNGWVGGNARQIEAILLTTQNADLRTIMRAMSRRVRGLDIYFAHVDTDGTSSDTLSSIRVSKVDQPLLLAQTDRTAWWQQRIAALLREAPAGATARLIDERALETSGHPALQGTVRVELPEGGAYLEVIHMVQYDAVSTHVFQLRADQNKFPARRRDFVRLLDTVIYR